MKHLFTISAFITAILSFATSADLHAQIGEAILFDYDQSGNRIKRWYNSSTSLLKESGDTLTRTTPPDTIRLSPGETATSEVVVKAYPNPVTSELTVENYSWKKDNRAVVRVFDVAGKHITTKELMKAKDYIDFSALASGTYMVLYYLDNTLLVSWKLVKQ
jgi:hypothetical protein